MSLTVDLVAYIDIGRDDPEKVILYTAGYTHNCGEMAEEAGLYKYVWRPEECPDVKTAADLIEPLRNGIALMREDPARFEAFNPDNGFGKYSTFLPWLERYLEACIMYPKALIEADR